MFSTPSVRPCLAAATPPAVSVEDRRSQESLHVHAGGLCDMGANWRGKGGGGRDNAALPLVTRGWLCLRMECTAVTSHIRVCFFVFVLFFTKDRALAWCTIFLSDAGTRCLESKTLVWQFLKVPCCILEMCLFVGELLTNEEKPICDFLSSAPSHPTNVCAGVHSFWKISPLWRHKGRRHLAGISPQSVNATWFLPLTTKVQQSVSVAPRFKTNSRFGWRL